MCYTIFWYGGTLKTYRDNRHRLTIKLLITQWHYVLCPPPEHKKKMDSWTSFTLMSRRGTIEKRTAKSDPIFHNPLVNMVVNRITKDRKKSLRLIKFSIEPWKKFNKRLTNQLLVLREAIRRVTPNIGVKQDVIKKDRRGSSDWNRI